MPETAPGAPPPKKGLSTGWTIFLVVAISVVVAGGSCVAWVAYQIASNKDVQNVVSVFGDATKVMLEAQKAPGTKELREAGCAEALAVDMSQVAKLADRFDAGSEPMERGYMVSCEWTKDTPPVCDELAKIYARAASPQGEFQVIASTRDQDTSCSGRYDASGALLSREP